MVEGCIWILTVWCELTKRDRTHGNTNINRNNARFSAIECVDEEEEEVRYVYIVGSCLCRPYVCGWIEGRRDGLSLRAASITTALTPTFLIPHRTNITTAYIIHTGVRVRHDARRPQQQQRS